jgi:hypothetical protein
MAKHPLTILEAELSVPAIGLALGLGPDEVLKKFSDPRVTSWFAEIWGERLFRYKAHLSSNHPGSDARVELGALGRFDISVRCFNRNTIKFQKSKFIGSGRSATLDDLIESIESVERIVVVDLRRCPKLRFVPLDSKPLLRLVRLGRLTPTGISPSRFDAWLQESFETSVRQTTLGQPDAPPPAPTVTKPARPADLFG